MDFLQKLMARADLGDWSSWSPLQRILAIVVAGLLVYWLLRTVLPTVLRLLRPVLLLLLVVAAVWAVFPKEMCSMEWTANLPVLCAH